MNGTQQTESMTAMVDETPRGRVVRIVRQWIADGLIGRGQPLPSARVLSQRLQVDRRTVSRALDVLKQEGMLRSQGGHKGAVVPAVEPQTVAVLQHAVVLLSPDTEMISTHHQTGWAERITMGSVAAIREAGLHAMVLHPYRREPEEIRRVLLGKPYGVLIPEISDSDRKIPELLHSVAGSGVSVVVYGGSPDFASFDRVMSDHEEGTYDLTRWLVGQGRRRVVPFWPVESSGYWFAARRRGYERAMREAGLEPLPTLEMPEFPVSYEDPKVFKDLVRHLAGYLTEVFVGATPADGLLLATDGHYCAVEAACRLHGKISGQDVTLVGYDNYWADTPERVLTPESTGPRATVDKCNYEMGREMVRLLVERMEGRLPEEPQSRVVKPEMIICR